MDWTNDCSCGLPLFANAISAKCKHCDKHIELQINPRIVSWRRKLAQICDNIFAVRYATWRDRMHRSRKACSFPQSVASIAPCYKRETGRNHSWRTELYWAETFIRTINPDLWLVFWTRRRCWTPLCLGDSYISKGDFLRILQKPNVTEDWTFAIFL